MHLSEHLNEARLMLAGLDSIPGTSTAQAILIERLGHCLDAISELLNREVER